MKKILVRAPHSIEGIVSSFTFFHRLYDEYKDEEMGVEINIISDEDISWIYHFLPFNVKVFDFPKEKNSIPGIHQYSVTQNEIFNIDLYFDLVNDFKSCFLGFSFKAKERVGFDNGLKSKLHTHKVPMKSLGQSDDLSMKLLSHYLGKNLDNYVIRTSETFEGEKEKPLFENIADTPYFLIVSDEKDFEIDIWKPLIHQLEGKKTLLWNRFDKSDFSGLLEEFDDKKKFSIVHSLNLNEIDYLLNHSIGTFSNIPWLLSLSTYLGKKSFFFGKSSGPQLTMNYWDRNYARVELSEEGVYEVHDRGEVFEMTSFLEIID